MTALRALLAGSIDYAGLFPPAALDMGAAAANYSQYLVAGSQWALGRFVVPASRLEELERAVSQLPRAERGGAPWHLSALLGADPAIDIRLVGELNCRQAARDKSLAVDVLEAKAGTADEITSLLEVIPSGFQAYIEVPFDRAPDLSLDAIARGGAGAKIRTGGVTSDAFPTAAEVARFIRGCVSSGVRFKATAGLHHPLRGDYPLTYAGGSPRGTMFGFLNVFLAAGFAMNGMPEPQLVELLEDPSITSFAVRPDFISWRGHRLALPAIEALRQRAMVAFGSCSFAEPLADLAALGLL